MKSNITKKTTNLRVESSTYEDKDFHIELRVGYVGTKISDLRLIINSTDGAECVQFDGVDTCTDTDELESKYPYQNCDLAIKSEVVPIVVELLKATLKF